VLIAEPHNRNTRLRDRVLGTASVALAAVVCLLVGAFVAVQVTGAEHGGHAETAGPNGSDYVDIRSVPPVAAAPAPAEGGSTGSFTDRCGRDAVTVHRNADNVIAAPRVPGGAHHTHDYVGNLSTGAFSTDASLAAAGTTCADGDLSTFYWPVLRVLGEQGTDQNAVGGGADGNLGRILTPASAVVKFVGDPATDVVPMPRFLRAVIGDPKAIADGNADNAQPQWTCTGHTDRVTRLYPLCPTGSDVERVFDFPNCWNGTALDSPTHTTHLVAAARDGACPHGTFPVPRLTITVTYHVPTGAMFAIDSFPEDFRSPLTDHSDFIDLMTDQQQATVVACINEGRQC
jgi:hypothetical protein